MFLDGGVGIKQKTPHYLIKLILGIKYLMVILIHPVMDGKQCYANT